MFRRICRENFHGLTGVALERHSAEGGQVKRAAIESAYITAHLCRDGREDSLW